MCLYIVLDTGYNGEQDKSVIYLEETDRHFQCQMISGTEYRYNAMKVHKRVPLPEWEVGRKIIAEEIKSKMSP